MTGQGITVVIPTLNRGASLQYAVQDMLAQAHAPLEVLVVDQSPRMPEWTAGIRNTPQRALSYHHVTFRGLPQARNYGWQHARHEAIVFVDDDVRSGPALVSEHLRALERPGVGLVAGGIDECRSAARPPVGRAGTFNPWTATPRPGFDAAGEYEADHAQGCNFSAWRRVLQAVGGFDEALNVGAALYEETDLCLRIKEAGYRVYFNGAARLTHLPQSDGGCRVPDIRPYVRGLAQNRAAMIRRHVAWFRRPVALSRLALLGISYARAYRSPGVLVDCLAGCWFGHHLGKQTPVCTEHRQARAV